MALLVGLSAAFRVSGLGQIMVYWLEIAPEPLCSTAQIVTSMGRKVLADAIRAS